MKFQFKEEYLSKSWNDFDTVYKFHPRFSEHSDVAEYVAEDYYNQDPSDPNYFQFDILIKDENGLIKRFIVSAEAEVTFRANEEVLK